MRAWSVWGLLAAHGACGDSGFCVEQNVTIAQGLYGRVTYQTDVSPDTNPPEPAAGELVQVYDAPGGSVVANASSGSDGVFQIELDPGSYAACYAIAAFSCEAFDVVTTRLARVDLHKGFGTYWQPEVTSGCAD